MPERRALCASADLQEGGAGVRFTLDFTQEAAGERPPAPAFAIRWHGQVRAYLNRCGHVPVELDYENGQFFDFSGCYLVCTTHGALYDPATGRCVGGRCQRTGLVSIPVAEENGTVYLLKPSKEPHE